MICTPIIPFCTIQTMLKDHPSFDFRTLKLYWPEAIMFVISSAYHCRSLGGRSGLPQRRPVCRIYRFVNIEFEQ